VVVISVSLPDSLAQDLDAFSHARGYSGRSELVRAALRDFLARETTMTREGPGTATLTLLYDEGNERAIGEIRHNHTDIVTSMMHSHAAGHCVEVFVINGPRERLRAFADALRAARATRLVHVVDTDAGGVPGVPSRDAADGHGHQH